MSRPAWLDTVKAGDVLETPSGDLRLVRNVTRWQKRGLPPHVCVTFAIRRCSWTHRPYTVYSSADAALKAMRWVGHYRGKLTTLDFRLQREIAGRTIARDLDCCAVRGLP